MNQRPVVSYNPYFIVPFLIWVVAGGFLLASYDKETLFAALNTRHNPFLDVCMYYITMAGEAVLIIAVLLLLMLRREFRTTWYFLTAVVCNLLPALVVQLLKRFFDAPRPLGYFNDAEWIHLAGDWPRYYHHSFPSGHTSGAFCMCCFLACMLPQRYRAWGIALFLLAMLVGYSRIYLAVHFFADVYAGSITGTVMTLAGLAIMLRVRSRFISKKDSITSNSSL